MGRLAPMALPRQSIHGSCFSSHGIPRIKSYLSMFKTMNRSVLSKPSNFTARFICTFGTAITVPSASITDTDPLPELSRSASVNLSLFVATVWRRTKFVDAQSRSTPERGCRILVHLRVPRAVLHCSFSIRELLSSKSPWCAPTAHPSWGLSVSPVGRPAPTGSGHSPGPGDAASASAPLDWSLGEATYCVDLPLGTCVACAPACHRGSSAHRAAARPH